MNQFANDVAEVPQAVPGGIAVVDAFVGRYYAGLVNPTHAMLAVFGSMALDGRTNPLSLILETPSGYGKTATLQMAFPAEGSGLERYVYRSDKFTPRSFVSHAANVKAEDLAKIDMLPKLENRVLITKELAPIFRGREEELQENFSILISVLDGKGYTTDSGMRGQRGYARPVLFNWIGATTPLPPATHRLMSQLGTRLMFYEVPVVEPTEDDLLRYALADSAGEAEQECQKVVNQFLTEFFEQHPVGTVKQAAVALHEDLARKLAKWAKFLVKARAAVSYEKDGNEWKPVSVGTPEGAWKVVTYLKDLARGHALVCGRDEVTEDDLSLVAEVALSSIPGHLRPLVRALRTGEGIDSADAERTCRATRPTVRKYFRELELLGIAELQRGSPQTNEPDRIVLPEPYQWMKPTNASNLEN
jgi:hypothetical protein